ncbi:hypothetical protein ILUMI_00400, partial [Ignelater luminosus]
SVPTTDLWLMLNKNLQSHYVPSECVVIDEQLFLFRVMTKFTQYMPSNHRNAESKFCRFVTLTTLFHLLMKYILGSHHQGEKSTRTNES